MRIFPSARATRGALLTLLFAIGLPGCYTATFMANPNLAKGEQRDQWNSFFLWGLVGEETLDVRQFCGNGPVAQVQTGANVLTVLVTGVTLGIYAPRKAYVWCAAGGPPAAAPAAGTPAPKTDAAAVPPATGKMLAIYGDSHGRPLRVELLQDGAVAAVAKPAAVDATQSKWEVAFAREVAR